MLHTKPPQGTLIDWSHPQAAGLKLCLPFNEGGGVPVDNVSGQLINPVGPATWSPTLAGQGRSGYVNGIKYDIIDPPQQVLGTNYPFWSAVGLITPTAANDVVPWSTGVNSATYPASYLRLNFGSVSGKIVYEIWDNSNTSVALFVTGINACADGGYHVFVCVSYSPSDHRIYVDGAQVGSTTSTIGTITTSQHTLGGFRHGGTNNIAYSSGSIVWHMAGNGAVPDLAALNQDPYQLFLPTAALRAAMLTVSTTTVIIMPAGLSSGFTAGSPTLGATAGVSPSTVASSASVGSPTASVACTVSPAGISTGEAVGSPSTSASCAVAPAGIDPASSVGTPQLATVSIIAPAGIVSAAAVGSPSAGVACSIGPAGLASTATVAQPAVTNNGTPVDLPVDLLAAITSRIQTSDIADLFTGGITSVKASDRAIMPYVVVRKRSSNIELRTSDSNVASVVVETRTYAADTDTAGNLGDALRPVLEGSVNTFTGAVVSPLIPEGDPQTGKETGRGKDSAEVRYYEQVYRCRVKRPRQ